MTLSASSLATPASLAVTTLLGVAFFIYKALPKDPLPSVPSMPFRALLTMFRLRQDILKNYYFGVPRSEMEKHGIRKFWLGRYFFVLGRWSHARVLAKHPDIFEKASLGKVVPHTLALTFIGMENVVNSNGETWKRFRKVMNPAFRQIPPLDVFQRCTDVLMAEWEKVPRDHEECFNVNVHNWMSRLTMEVLGQSILGYDFQVLTTKDPIFVRNYATVMKASMSGFYFSFPRLDRWWNPLRYRSWKAFWELDAEFDRIIQLKRAEMAANDDEEEAKDILALILKGYDEGDLNYDELKANLRMMFIAGFDTTSLSLVSILYLLAKHPDYQEKVRREVLSVLRDSHTPPTQAHKMPLLDAIIYEAMRLYPPIMDMPMRQLSQDIELEFGERELLSDGTYASTKTVTLPKGCTVGLSILVIHRDSKVFQDPDSFYPERFLKPKSDGSGEMGVDTSLSFAFSGGSRLGMNFSLAEQRVVICSLLRKYRWELPEGSIHSHHLVFDGATLLMPRPVDIKFKEL